MDIWVHRCMDGWLGRCIGKRTKEKIQVNELKNKHVDIR